MDADRGRVPTPGLARPPLHVQELAPGQLVYIVALAEPMRVEPRTDRRLSDHRAVRAPRKVAQLNEKRARRRAREVTRLTHA